MEKIKVYSRKDRDKLYLYSRIHGKTFRYATEYSLKHIQYVEKNKHIIFKQIHNKSEKNIDTTFESYGKYVIAITSNNRSSFTQKEVEYKFGKLCNYFGQMQLSEINASTIQAWQNGLNFSPKTINNYRGVLSQVLKMAIADQIIIVNPLNYVKTPKKHKKIKNTYNEFEIIKLISSNSNIKYFLQVAFFSGMRTGEMIALNWDDIDFNNNKIYITKSIRDGIIQPPKGNKERIIDMLPQVKKALLELQLLNNSKYVFVNQYGKFYKNSNSLAEQFHKLCAELGLKKGRLYDTRGSFATLMANANVNHEWLLQQQGWQTMQVGREHYIGNVNQDIMNLGL